jgi:putative membrane protein (TIGR04086 family)
MNNRWVRILIAGVAGELALFLLIPLNFVPWGPAVLQVIVIPACLIALFLAGWWATCKAARLHVLDGLLVGLLAVVLYYAVAWGQELPLTYHIAGAAKLVGGAAGGWWAGRKAAAI